MEIIPVLDMMQGQVVQAVKGQRKSYCPVDSVLTNESDPLAIAQSLQKTTNSKSIYLADLDAILGDGDHGPLIQHLAENLSCRLWVDAGAANLGQAQKLLDEKADKAIICSESLKSLNDLKEITQNLPSEKIIFSLDIKDQKIMTATDGILGEDPIKALAKVSEMGFDNFILMTLDQVGTGKGPAWSLIKEARALLPNAYLAAAGGVKDTTALSELISLDINACLVATCLHKGWVTKEQISLLK